MTRLTLIGKSVLENVPIKSTFRGKYAAYNAYLFCLKTLAAERNPTIYIDNKRMEFKDFKELAEKQSKEKEEAESQKKEDSNIIEC